MRSVFLSTDRIQTSVECFLVQITILHVIIFSTHTIVSIWSMKKLRNTELFVIVIKLISDRARTWIGSSSWFICHTLHLLVLLLSPLLFLLTLTIKSSMVLFINLWKNIQAWKRHYDHIFLFQQVKNYTWHFKFFTGRQYSGKH